MKNIEEFSKLFKVNIPVEEHADYYIGLLQSVNYENIEQKLKDFKTLEESHEHITSVKFNALGFLSNSIKASKAYQNFYKEYINELASNNELHPKLDERKRNKYKIFLSIDLSNANYSVIKKFDTENELGIDWTDFCAKQGCAALAPSKSFRQFVFGNVNPKAIQRTQHLHITSLVEKLKDLKSFLIFVSYDEIIFAFETQEELNKHKEKVAKECELFELNTKTQTYTLYEFEKDMFVKTNLDTNAKTLINVPGNQFYQHFKQQIIGGEVEDRDLFFISDHKLAKWIFVDKYKFNQTKTEPEHGC